MERWLGLSPFAPVEKQVAWLFVRAVAQIDAMLDPHLERGEHLRPAHAIAVAAPCSAASVSRQPSSSISTRVRPSLGLGLKFIVTVDLIVAGCSASIGLRQLRTRSSRSGTTSVDLDREGAGEIGKSHVTVWPCSSRALAPPVVK